MERSGLPWISLEDERLIGAGPELLDGLLQSWYALHPQGRQPQPEGRRPCLFIDEVQVIPGWEGLETVVIVELKRRGADLWYLRSENGREVDALAVLPDGRQLLVQVCASLADATTRERELTALLDLAATEAGRSAESLLISLDAQPPDLGAAARQVRWQPAIEWLLDNPS